MENVDSLETMTEEQFKIKTEERVKAEFEKAKVELEEAKLEVKELDMDISRVARERDALLVDRQVRHQVNDLVLDQRHLERKADLTKPKSTTELRDVYEMYHQRYVTLQMNYSSNPGMYQTFIEDCLDKMSDIEDKVTERGDDPETVLGLAEKEQSFISILESSRY